MVNGQRSTVNSQWSMVNGLMVNGITVHGITVEVPSYRTKVAAAPFVPCAFLQQPQFVFQFIDGRHIHGMGIFHIDH